MNGIEICHRYFEEYGLPMLDAFREAVPFIAAGLTGSGSECYGFDDELSRDHDFEPGFCLFLPDENTVDRRTAFLLERAYAKLPKSFLGLTRSPVNPVGGNRHGVFRIAEFFNRQIGSPDGQLSWSQWLSLPSYRLAEAVNGEVFADPSGMLTAIRERLLNCPEDIRRKKLAGSLALMSQSGPYNFSRCIKHGEPAAAQLAANLFVQQTLLTEFLLNDRYCPFYKWAFRALRALPGGSETEADLLLMLSGDNGCPETVSVKEAAIERICDSVSKMVRSRGYSDLPDSDLDMHARRINDGIRDPQIRNLHLLAGAETL